MRALRVGVNSSRRREHREKLRDEGVRLGLVRWCLDARSVIRTLPTAGTTATSSPMLALVMSGLSSRCVHLGLESTRAVGACTGEKLRDEGVRLGLVRWCTLVSRCTERH